MLDKFLLWYMCSYSSLWYRQVFPSLLIVFMVEPRICLIWLKYQEISFTIPANVSRETFKWIFKIRIYCLFMAEQLPCSLSYLLIFFCDITSFSIHCLLSSQGKWIFAPHFLYLFIHNRISTPHRIRRSLYPSWYKQVPAHFSLLFAIEAWNLRGSLKQMDFLF